MRAAARRLGFALCLLAAAGCGRSNPVLGDWQVDRGETPPGVMLALQATDLTELSLEPGGVSSGEFEIQGTWIVEPEAVRLVRADGTGEHRIALLPGDRIRIELPIGVSAVYRRAGG